MLSLIIPCAWRRLACSATLAGTMFLSVGVHAAADFGQQFLEEVTVEPVGHRAEVHVHFAGQIRYLRHFPERKGDTLKIALDVVDPCIAEEILTQESRWLPPADWHVPVTVTFPDSIKRSSTGPALCQATHHQVYVGHTLAVKFGKESEYQVRPGSDGRSLVISVPLLKQPESAKPPVKAPIAAAAAPVSPAKVEVPVTTKTKSTPLPSQPTTEPMPAQAKDPLPGSAPVVAKADKPVQVEAPKVEAPKVEAPPSLPELPAVDLMTAGRTALSAGDAVSATQYFNRLLNLPPNDYSQEAQELVGVAREQTGEIEKAKAEYQLYLSLYATGEGADRVKKRLAALEAVKQAPKEIRSEATKPVKKPIKQIHQNTFTGSVSQYYYAGKTQSRSVNSADEVTKTRSTDQSTLITNVDATERMRHNQYDTKIVFRDTQVHNFLPGRIDKNTVSAAYVEHQNKAEDYMFRLGRQSGTSQGVLGRFDGVFARYGLNPRWRITGVAGVPDNGSQSSVKTDRHFYGVGVEFGPLAEKWSGTVYGIQQVADGLTERRALGTEMRYFSGTTSWFGLLDYDTLYDDVNMAMVQGNWTAEGGYNFNLLLDHRKSPILYGETAIQSVIGARSVQDLRVMLSSGDIYSNVKALVPESDMAMFGVTKQVSPRWQVGGDVRVTHIGPTDGIPPSASNPTGFDPQPGIKNNYTMTLQAIGANTLFKNDTSVVMASFVKDPDYNAQNLSFSNSIMMSDKWRIDSALRYYQEKRDAGQKTWKVTPSMRMNYRFRDNMSFEAELNIDYTNVDDPVAATTTDTWRETLFAGYRWDFR